MAVEKKDTKCHGSVKNNKSILKIFNFEPLFELRSKILVPKFVHKIISKS
jgi:hypothetical protein